MTTQVITYNLHKALGYRERIVAFLVITIVIAAGSYIFFVHKAVVNVVSRQDIMQQIQKEDSKMNILESRYLALDNSITLDNAAKYGFVPTEVSVFIPTKSVGLVPSASKI